MALSNWDTLGIGPDGKSNNGEYTFNNGTKVEIYKNWAFLANEKMYTKETADHQEPIIGSVNKGDVNIGGVTIKAERGPQNSIFILASKSTYHKDAEGDDKFTYEHFAGIGCYGFESRIDEYLQWKGITIPFEHTDVTTGSQNYRRDEEGNDIPLDGFIDTITFYRFDKNDDDVVEHMNIEVDKEFGDLTGWVGVLPSTMEEFKTFLKKHSGKYERHAKAWFETIDWDELTRFNQGDAFFIGAENSQTKVGESEETIFEQIVDSMKNEEGPN
jgi:hypothetical protein